MGEDRKNEFIKGLYGKYGVDIDDQGLQRAAQMFEQDFDSALGSFYKQFGIDKQVDPKTSLSLQEDYGFMQLAQQAPTGEENYFGGGFGDLISKAEQIPVIGSIADFVDDMGRAVGAGGKQGALVTPANQLFLSGSSANKAQVDKYIKAATEMETYTPSDEMMEFNEIYEREGGVFGVLKGLVNNPSVLPEIMISSIRAMMNTSSATAAGSVVGGSAGAGALFGGAGAAPAALGSIPFALGAAGTVLETGLTFSELLKEEIEKRGLEFTEEGVRTILNDSETLNSIRKKAGARGATIGIIDALTGRLAGKVGAKIVSGSVSRGKLKGNVAGALIESGGGSFGETAGMLVAGQELDIAEIMLEGLAEAPMAGINIAAEIARRPTKIIVDGNQISIDQLENIVKKSTADELVALDIKFENDSKNYASKFEKAVAEKSAEKKKTEFTAKIEQAEKVVDPISDPELEAELNGVLAEFSTIVAESKASKEAEKSKMESDAAITSPSIPAAQLGLPSIETTPEVIDLTETQEEVADADTRTEEEVNRDVEQDRPAGEIGLPAPEAVGADGTTTTEIETQYHSTDSDSIDLNSFDSDVDSKGSGFMHVGSSEAANQRSSEDKTAKRSTYSVEMNPKAKYLRVEDTGEPLHIYNLLDSLEREGNISKEERVSFENKISSLDNDSKQIEVTKLAKSFGYDSTVYVNKAEGNSKGEVSYGIMSKKAILKIEKNEQATEKADGKVAKTDTKAKQEERVGDPQKGAGETAVKQIATAVRATNEKLDKLTSLVKEGKLDGQSRRDLKSAPAQIDKYINRLKIKEGPELDALNSAKEKFNAMIKSDADAKGTTPSGKVAPQTKVDNKNKEYAEKANSKADVSRGAGTKGYDPYLTAIKKVEVDKLEQVDRDNFVNTLTAVAQRLSDRFANGTATQINAFLNMRESLGEVIKKLTEAEKAPINEILDSSTKIAEEVAQNKEATKAKQEEAKAEKASITEEQQAEIDRKKDIKSKAKAVLQETGDAVHNISQDIRNSVLTVEASKRRLPGLQATVDATSGFTNMTVSQVQSEKVASKTAIGSINKAIAKIEAEISDAKSKLAKAMKARDKAIVDTFDQLQDPEMAASYGRAMSRLNTEGFYNDAADNIVKKHINESVSQETGDIIDKALSNRAAVKLVTETSSDSGKPKATRAELKASNLLSVTPATEADVENKGLNSLKFFARTLDMATKAANDIQNLYTQLKSQGKSESDISSSPQMASLRDAANRAKAKAEENRANFILAYDSLAYGMPRKYIPGIAQNIIDRVIGRKIDSINDLDSLKKDKWSNLSPDKTIKTSRLSIVQSIFNSVFSSSDSSVSQNKRVHRAVVALANKFKLSADNPIIINLNLIPHISKSQYEAIRNSVINAGQATIDHLINQGNYDIDTINSYSDTMNTEIGRALDVLSDARYNGTFAGSFSLNAVNPIIAYGGKTIQNSINTFAHEMGHTIRNTHFEDADGATKIAVYREFIAWRDKNKKALKDSSGSISDVAKKFTSAVSTPITAALDRSLLDAYDKAFMEGKLSPEQYESLTKDVISYRIDFDEYFAEQTALYINEEKAPVGVIEKFFHGIAQKLKDFYNQLKDSSDIKFERSETIKQFLDGVISVSKNKNESNKALYTAKASNNIASFQTPPSQQAQAAGNRDVLLEQIRGVVEGRFTNKTQYNNLIKRVNEQLKANGLDPITTAEREIILKNTESGAVATIEGIIMKEGQKRPTMDLKAVRDSLRATKEARDDAQAQKSALLERLNDASAEPLTQAELDSIETLELVGIEHASLEDKQAAIKLARNIAKNNSLAVNNASAKAADGRAKVESELVLESLLGTRPDANGMYDITVGRRNFVFTIHDTDSTYIAGDRVFRRGKIYEANEDIPTGSVFTANKWTKVGSIGIPYTKAGYIARFKQAGFFQKVVATIMKWELPLDGMLSYLDKLAIRDSGSQNFKSKLVTYASRKLIDAVTQSNKYVSGDYQTAISEINKVIGGKSWVDAAKAINALRTEEITISFEDANGANVDIIMTKAEAMYKYALLQDPNARHTFDAMANNASYDVSTDMGWSANKEAALLAVINEDMKKMVNVFREHVFPPIFERINNAHKAQFGFDLVREENYIPWKRYAESGNSAESYFLFDGTGDVQSMVKAVTNPSTVARTRSTAAFQSSDFFEVAFRYSENASHYSTHLEPVSILSNILQRGEVASYISTTMGKEYKAAGDKLLANVATGRAAGYTRIAAFDAMRTGLILGSLGGNLTLLPKQLTSMPAYANSMNPIRWAGMMATAPARLMTGSLTQTYREMLNTDFIKDRLKKSHAANPDLVDLTLGNIESSIGKYRGTMRLGAEVAFKRAVEVLMLPTKLGDIGAILVGGEPLYTSTYQDAIKNGMSEGDARKEAEFKLAEATSRTQQSDLIMDRAGVQTHGSLSSLLVTFMSTPILYGRMASAAYRDIYYGRGSLKKAVGQALLFTYILPSLFYMVSTGSLGLIFGDEDDERFEKGDNISRNLFIIMMGSIQHIPVAYPLISNFMDRAFFGNKFRASAIPTVSRIEKGTEAIGNAILKLKESGELDSESIIKIAREAAILSGVNLKSAENLIENWGDIIGGDMPSDELSSAVYMGMGFSKEALGLREYGAKSKEAQRTPKPVNQRRDVKSKAQRKLDSRKRKMDRLRK